MKRTYEVLSNDDVNYNPYPHKQKKTYAVEMRLSDLPNEMLDKITSYLPYRDLKQLSKTNERLGDIAKKQQQKMLKTSCLYPSFIFSDDKAVTNDLDMIQDVINGDTSDVKARKYDSLYLWKGNDYELQFNFNAVVMNSFNIGELKDATIPVEGSLWYNSKFYNCLIGLNDKSFAVESVAIQTDWRCLFGKENTGYFNPFMAGMLLYNEVEEMYQSIFRVLNVGVGYVTETLLHYFYDTAKILGSGLNSKVINMSDDDLLHFCQSMIYALNFIGEESASLVNICMFELPDDSRVQCKGTPPNTKQKFVPMIVTNSDKGSSEDSELVMLLLNILTMLYSNDGMDGEEHTIFADVLNHQIYPKTVLYLIAMIAKYGSDVDIPEELEMMTIDNVTLNNIRTRIQNKLGDSTVNINWTDYDYLFEL